MAALEKLKSLTPTMNQNNKFINGDKSINLNILRYANCWEDTDLLTSALSIKAGENVLSVGSGGENSFALLKYHPQKLIICDVSQVQLYLIELKIVAIKYLTREDNLKFLGYHTCVSRQSVYNSLRKRLSPSCEQYWNHHLPQINKGVIYSGKFEKYLSFFAKKILPFAHNKTTIHKLFSTKDDVAQKTFFNTKWNNYTWRIIISLFFNKYTLGKYGRDPKFLSHVEVNVVDYIKDKINQHFKSTLCQNNPMLNFCLLGHFGNYEPFYLRKENFDIIKNNLSSINLELGLAENVIQKYNNLDKMNLSNIFEYMDDENFKTTSAALIHKLSKDGKMAYWNLMVPRQISSIDPTSIKNLPEYTAYATKHDRGFFYNNFFIDTKI
jgi:S-adenosylmethionine-diacylglycerol 3-amino-3-carboxypropyl transferase